jgi:hypothetical protein
MQLSDDRSLSIDGCTDRLQSTACCLAWHLLLTGAAAVQKEDGTAARTGGNLIYTNQMMLQNMSAAYKVH